MGDPTLRLHFSQRHSHEEYGGPRRWFRLFVHPTKEDLQRAAARYDPGPGDWAGTLGCCHPAHYRYQVDAKGDVVDVSDRHWGGVVRVTRDVSTEVLAHEVTHAALVVYRRDVCRDVRLGDECRQREETFAYINGDLLSTAARALYEAGIW
jgi:hypothetical protein